MYSMLANVLPLFTPSTPEVGSNGKNRVFLPKVMTVDLKVANQIKGNEVYNTMQANILPLHT